MKIANFIIKFIDKLVNILVTIFFLFILFIGLYAIYDYYYISNGTKLSDDIITLKEEAEENKEKTISLEKLKEINKDIIGWIKIDDTVVDFPLLYGKNNDEYLSLDYKRNYSISGSIFVDYRNKSTFTDQYTIIYGHNMPNGQMFGSLNKYSDRSYFDKHRKGIISADKNYDLEIIGYTSKSAYDDLYDLTMSQSEIFNYFKKDAIIFIDEPLKSNERLIILSTCDSINKNERNILLVKIFEKTIENTNN